MYIAHRQSNVYCTYFFFKYFILNIFFINCLLMFNKNNLKNNENKEENIKNK